MVRIGERRNGFGVVEVLGVVPGDGKGDAGAVRFALARHGVPCLRLGRALEDEKLQAVARLFGPIKDPVARAKDGTPFRYDQPRQIIDSGFVLTDEIRANLGELSFGASTTGGPGCSRAEAGIEEASSEPGRATRWASARSSTLSSLT